MKVQWHRFSKSQLSDNTCEHFTATFVLHYRQHCNEKAYVSVILHTSQTLISCFVCSMSRSKSSSPSDIVLSRRHCWLRGWAHAMLVIPGQRVGHAPTLSGPGTYTRGQHIHSSLNGHLVKYVDEEGKACVKVACCSFANCSAIKKQHNFR